MRDNKDNMSKQRILIVDDDASITDFLRRGLTYEGYATEVVHSGEDALSSLRENSADLVLLDWMLPGISGGEVLERIKTVNPSQPVIMLTAKDSPANQVEGFGLGADDYVVKPVQFEVLLARIGARLRGQELETPKQIKFSDIRMDTLSHTVFRGENEVNLTALEFKFLKLFIGSPERVFSKPIILDRVWGEDFFGDTNVVEVYVMQLRQKLEAFGGPRLLHNIRGVGYVLREQSTAPKRR